MTGPGQNETPENPTPSAARPQPDENAVSLGQGATLRSPFWSWHDVGLFFGLGIPAFLCAAVLVRFVASLAHIPGDRPAVLVAQQAVGYLLLFAILTAILRVNYGAPFWRSLGWVRSRFADLSAVTLGAVLSIVIAVAGGLLRVEPRDSEMQKLLQSPQGAYVLAAFGITLAPLAEELCFRGFLQPLFIRTAGVTAGILITSISFGMLHFQEYGNSWGSAALVSAAGVVFGLTRHLSGSTRSSTLVHAGYNGMLFALFFAVGKNIKS